MAFDLSTAKPISSAPRNGGFDLASAKPVAQDDYEPLYQKYVKDYNDTANQVPIPGTPPVDQGPLLSKEDWKARNDKRFRDNLLSIPLAIGEQAGNLAGGLAGTFAAPVVAGAKALNDLSQGRDTSFEKDYSHLFGEASGIGTKLADMTGINTGAREAISQGVGNVMNRIGIPMAGLNIPHINKNAELRRAMPEAFMQPEIPKVNPVMDNLKKFDLETAKPVEPEAQPSTAMSPSQLKDWADIQERYAQYGRDQEALGRQNAAQEVLNARQKALEQDVARQGGLDRNAAQRARQEAAPTGYSDWQVNQAAQEAQQTHDWLKQRQQDSIVEDYGNNDPMNRMPEMRVDENGIPIRADLSMENQNLQNPLQRNLWGDELPHLTGDEQIPMTQALDNMPKGIQRNIGMSQLRGFNKPQRGAIDVKGIQEAYRKMKDGEGSLFDYLRSFKGTFDESYGHDMAIKSALEDTMDPRSRARIVFMSPDDFHKLAMDRDKSSFAKNSIGEEKRTSIREGLASAEGLVSVPMLRVDSGKVIGHEGRHRMDVFKENGIEQVPVIVRDTIHRNENGPLPYRHLISETGVRTIPMERLTDLNPVKSKGFKNKQAGKVDFKSIKEEAEKVGKFLSEVGRKTIDHLTPAERVAINAIGDDSYIPKGASPEEIIAAAKAQPDGPALYTQMQSGLGGAALKTDSAMMFGVNRHLSWAHKVAEKAVREKVKPIEHKLSLLSPSELQTAHGILKEALFNRRQYTTEQLVEAGANQKTIDAYNMLRRSYEDVYNNTNASRAKLGLDPITRQAAYYSSQWNGNWHMPVRDKAGNLVGYVKTETRAEANKAIKWIKENMPDVDASTLKVEYKPQNIGKGLPRDVTSTFNTMMNIFEDTPMAQQMKEMMDKYRTEQAFNERGFSKHFEEKANTRFFLGDRPWLSEKENAHAGMKSQINYLKEAYRWAPLQEAMSNIKEVLSDPDLVKNQPNNMAVTKAYVANAMGISKSIMRGLENDVAQMTGRSPGQFGGWISSLKSLTYLQQLGASAGYAIATPMQAFILGPSRHLLLSKEGYKYNPLTTAVKAMKDMGALLATHEAYNISGKDMRNNLSPVGRAALRYMEDNGIINMNLFDEYANLGENKPMNLLKNTLGATISFPEKMARTMTFMSFVHHLKEGGMDVGLEMFRKAEELTNATLTEFHKNARPLIVDRMGMTGELLYTYKSPLFNYYNSLFEFGRVAADTGDYRPIVAALFMTGALGGVMNLPGVSELDGAWDLIRDGVAQLNPDWYPSIRDSGIREAALRHLPDWATYGTMSTVTGAQMESRFSNQIIDPSNPLANVAPVAQEMKEQLAIGKFAINPNWTTFHEGAYQNLPPAVKGFQETTADTFKGPKRDNGTQTYYNPNQLDKRQAYVNRTPKDEAYRKFGLTSLPEARQRDVRYNSNEESKRLETARDSSMEKMFDAVVRKDQGAVQKYATAFFMNDGDGSEFEKELGKRIAASALTPEERQAVYTKTISDARNILRRLQMEQKVQ